MEIKRKAANFAAFMSTYSSLSGKQEKDLRLKVADILKNQDKETRHACAEACSDVANKIGTSFHSACINAKAK